MLVASILSSSHNVFYPLQNEFQFLITIILSSANAFNLDQSKNLSFGKELNDNAEKEGIIVLERDISFLYNVFIAPFLLAHELYQTKEF